MMASMSTRKQNLTISIDPQTIRKAKILAARRSTSISGLWRNRSNSLLAPKKPMIAPSARL